MVATVTIRRLTGVSVGPTSTDITSINTRANAEDVHSTGDTASPIEIPTAGSNFSFWVNTILHATTAPDNLLDNIEWFTDGGNSYGTGITLQVATAARASYTEAPGTIGVTGTELTDTNYTGGTITPATPTDNAFAFVTGAPLSVAGSTTTTGEFGELVIYQVKVITTATPGTKPATAEIITWRFDET
ncbi:hypothetical protein LCGC14_1053800 [marine sediment metagenome]|uniref:WxL domain-containing protein n=1 Tax=marine sediment metagenome TaxID=412755 RepID=A0A0F9MN12_9ZZZZ